MKKINLSKKIPDFLNKKKCQNMWLTFLDCIIKPRRKVTFLPYTEYMESM